MKIEKLKPGMQVYDVARVKMGNTSMTTVAIYAVEVESVDLEKRTVTASWNGNTPRAYREGEWSKWRLNKPMLVKSGFGQRLATREEVAAAKAASSSAD